MLIRYVPPRAANGTLSIFNTLGQVVASLVNEREEPGIYQALWNASTLPRGAYFYRMQAREADGGQAGECVW
jgi:hypothetical protein